MQSPRSTPSSGGVPAEVVPAAPGSAEAVADVETGATPLEGKPMRWVEPEVLAALEAELNGPELARGFARDYAALWFQRFSRLAAAVQAEDRPAALDAVISLKITSTMVGGIRLSFLAQALEDSVRAGDFVRGQALLARVAHHGVRTVSELEASYILKNG